MEELQRAIENVTYFSKKFPKEELELIGANRDEAIPYLREAVKKAVREKENLDENYNLHLYGIFLLAQFQDREFFPTLMELASLPEDTLDYLIGDVITEDLGSILYNTYNGEIDLLKQAVMDKKGSDFARSQVLDVMGQLYMDQTLGKQELQDFLREIVYKEESIGDYIYTTIAEMICRCHFTDMLAEVRRLYLDGMVDEYAIGGYDDSVDYMFTYGKKERRFCKSPIDTVKMLRGWTMFEKSSQESVVDEKEDEEDDDRLNRKLSGIFDEFGGGAGKTGQRKSVKIGRNDPCPCGSGKKYKQCCLKKSQLLEEGVESKQEQEKWLSSYPVMDAERVEGRVYLEDLYSSESIELDKMLYLALKQRAIPIWNREPEQVVTKRTRRYLTDAYRKFLEIVEREHIQNFSEYDNKYSIHYLCVEWFSELIELLEDDDRDKILKDVRETCKKMGMI
ncbi:MAG: DUF1186 domain-containing protein [Lachnospiraceae bacterium]|nr:DUF1186 domain-containing protein [Lachnospiraceae bacterium]MDE7204231.1 DUF1186 domain-containing protein [Lachnospiraceae bacterium]